MSTTLNVTIIIPMTDRAAKLPPLPPTIGSERVRRWPELRSGLPIFPDEVAREVQAEIEDAIDAHNKGNLTDLVFVTRSEMVGLRARRMVAEGIKICVTFKFAGSGHPDAHVQPDGEIDTWPKGLFSEDFEEVRAIRRAQRATEDAKKSEQKETP